MPHVIYATFLTRVKRARKFWGDQALIAGKSPRSRRIPEARVRQRRQKVSSAKLIRRAASERIDHCRRNGFAPSGRIFNLPRARSGSTVQGARIETPRLSLASSAMAVTVPAV